MFQLDVLSSRLLLFLQHNCNPIAKSGEKVRLIECISDVEWARFSAKLLAQEIWIYIHMHKQCDFWNTYFFRENNLKRKWNTPDLIGGGYLDNDSLGQAIFDNEYQLQM